MLVVMPEYSHFLGKIQACTEVAKILAKTLTPEYKNTRSLNNSLIFNEVCKAKALYVSS